MLLFGKTFGFTRVTYLIAYCVYTAASATIQEAKEGDFEANGKMMTFLEALKQGKTTCPVVQRSLDIINNNLKPDVDRMPQVQSRNASTEEPVITRDYLPAFPYQMHERNHDVEPSQQFMTMDGTSLDCFPEVQYADLDLDMYGTWFLPAA
jgi:hypothetical protein